MRKPLIIAYDVNPNLGSEAGAASLWLKIIAKRHQPFVVTDAKHRKDLEGEDYGSTRFFYIPLDDALPRFYKSNQMYFSAYKVFLKRALPLLNELIRTNDFGFMHCLTPEGVYMHNDLYKIGLPMMVGPLGGGLRTPKGFEGLFTSRWLHERLRDLLYARSMRSQARNEYFRRAMKILIGTSYLFDLLPPETHTKTEVMFDVMVDPSAFRPAPPESRKQTRIAYIARLDPQKGPTLLLEAMHDIAARRKDIHLTMAGEGSLAGELETFVRRHDLSDTVRLVGNLDREGVTKLLHRSDIYCLPTLREPGGVAILEAMSCGLPIITTDYGGPAYSVTEECGIRIKPTSIPAYIDDLVRALEFLADHPESRRRMGAKARQRVLDHFSPAAFENKVLALYDGMLRTRPDSAGLESSDRS